MRRLTRSDAGRIEAAGQWLGEPLVLVAGLDGGEECRVLRLRGASGDYVLHVYPSWRTRDELEWVHGIVAHVARTVPEAVGPVRTDAGSLIPSRDGMLVLSPHVPGSHLDREDARQRAAAARLLARIHRATMDWSGPGRPSSGPGRPTLTVPVPEDLRDAALDAWWEEEGRRTEPVAPIHGDYYRRNLLWWNGEISGVVDWSETRVSPLGLELAGAMFELCRRADRSLPRRRAQAFLSSYREGGGPVPVDAVEELLPFMRAWIREDALTSIAWEGQVTDYARLQMRAFRRLALR